MCDDPELEALAGRGQRVRRSKRQVGERERLFHVGENAE